ncbi:hypothetical protein SAMN05444159_2647 [Bradyrhizobium lablabi]|uniref:Uncharacterized protein n=1 Tax=Bradyrhizobium lablabi TaxID=722472 RepID=A0A1M6QE81_9BRAD|nr:hypothetical protein SAMN05444159_2647 [Bradyrhizobium lablabi]
MLTKHLLTISLLLPLAAISATAHAGSTISDKSYWPSEARQSAQTTTVSSPSDLNSSFALYPAASRLQPATSPNDGGWHYQGGPKSQVTRSGGR